MSPREVAARILWPMDRALAWAAYVGVVAYRRWISPRKGFRCAAAALTRQPSCSDVALQAFREQPFSRALPIIREQTAKCRKAYADKSQDLMESANAHLAQFGTLAAVSVFECNPCVPGPAGPI